MTASCAAVNASRTPKLKRLARTANGLSNAEVARMIATDRTTEASTASGDTSVRLCSRPNARGSCPCSPSEYASRPKPEIDVAAARRRMTPDSPT
jgi:hypothetical protein